MTQFDFSQLNETKTFTKQQYKEFRNHLPVCSLKKKVPLIFVYIPLYTACINPSIDHIDSSRFFGYFRLAVESSDLPEGFSRVAGVFICDESLDESRCLCWRHLRRSFREEGRTAECKLDRRSTQLKVTSDLR